MSEKRNCKIVQDLLPNYIDKLTNDETNQYIEEHLAKCNECKKIYDNMKQKLELNEPEKNSKEVKYIKKYNKKLIALKFTVFFVLIIALGVITYYYMLFRNAYFDAANKLVEVISETMYSDTFYATIEEISDSEISGIKQIKVKGLSINDSNHRGEFYFDVILDNIPDNFKLKWNNTNISIEQLKVGQTVAVYNYGKKLESEPANLTDVRMIVVLNDEI